MRANKHTRREFIKHGAVLCGSMAAGQAMAASALGALGQHPLLDQTLLLSGHKFVATGAPNEPRTFAVAALGMGYNLTIIVPHDVHSVLWTKRHPQLAIAIPKDQKLASLVNLREKRLLTSFAADQDCFFSGHGLFLKDSEYFFTSEAHDETHEGFLVLRRCKDGGIEKRFSSFGRYPHELKYITDGLIGVANGDAGITSLVIIEAENFTLQERFLPEDQLQRIRHFDFDLAGNMVIAGWPVNEEDQRSQAKSKKLAKIVTGSRRSKALSEVSMSATLETGHGFPYQYLSAAMAPEASIAIVTCQNNNSIFVVDAKSQKLIERLEHQAVTGVTCVVNAILGENRYLMVNSALGHLRFYDTKTRQLDLSLSLDSTTVTGPHVYSYTAKT